MCIWSRIDRVGIFYIALLPLISSTCRTSEVVIILLEKGLYSFVVIPLYLFFFLKFFRTQEVNGALFVRNENSFFLVPMNCCSCWVIELLTRTTFENAVSFVCSVAIILPFLRFPFSEMRLVRSLTQVNRRRHEQRVALSFVVFLYFFLNFIFWVNFSLSVLSLA